MYKKVIIYFTFINVCLIITQAQEVITGLRTNLNISDAGKLFMARKGLNSSDTLALPFFDDFSGDRIFPDSKKWTDSYVYINNTFSDRQITAGIATFDILDNAGGMYEDASVSGFKADQLTSQPINLKYSPDNNVWLSFFFQSGGLSDPPEATDTLVLQFFAPVERKWYSVWRAAGSKDQRLKPVIIRIDNDRYLKSGFQFRFVNYASLSPNLSDPSMVGNCDVWNIDYVLLDKNRNAADTIFADVALTLPLRSLLKSYESIPWKQFRDVYLQEMGSVFPIHYRNNDTITRNITRNFEIWDVYKNSPAHVFTAGATNIGPLTSVNYLAGLVYTYNTSNIDSALFRITASLKTDNFDPKSNDTLIYYQVFKNYFAFDDGSSEGGYGINGLGSRNAMAAYRFKSYMPDTLRAVRICFNDSYLNANQREFDLVVWGNKNGLPGNILYLKEEVIVEPGDAINGFYTYLLPEGVPVNDIFYVGWRQRSESFLNVGYDINTPNSGRQFFWLNGEWNLSQVPGSIMIRPVVGDPFKVTSINDFSFKTRKEITIWPNPTNKFINLNPDDLQLYRKSFIFITDMNGHELMKIPFSERVDISSLHDGMYFVVIRTNGIVAAFNRIIKMR